MTDPRYDDTDAPIVPQITPSDDPDDVETLKSELVAMRTRLARIERTLEGRGR